MHAGVTGSSPVASILHRNPHHQGATTHATKLTLDLNTAAVSAIDRAVATLDDSITRKVRGAILMQLDGVIKDALAGMSESVVASIKAALRSA